MFEWYRTDGKPGLLIAITPGFIAVITITEPMDSCKFITAIDFRATKPLEEVCP
jgi:hypothetical protein